MIKDRKGKRCLVGEELLCSGFLPSRLGLLISNGKCDLGVIDQLASAGFIKSGRCFFFCHAKSRKMQEFRENPIYLI